MSVATQRRKDEGWYASPARMVWRLAEDLEIPGRESVDCLKVDEFQSVASATRRGAQTWKKVSTWSRSRPSSCAPGRCSRCGGPQQSGRTWSVGVRFGTCGTRGGTPGCRRARGRRGERPRGGDRGATFASLCSPEARTADDCDRVPRAHVSGEVRISEEHDAVAWLDAEEFAAHSACSPLVEAVRAALLSL